MDTDITKTVQKGLRGTINGCKQMIPKSEKWKFINLNPMAPIMRGMIKVHKEGTPIRPVVNWKNSPGYKLAQFLTKLLTSHIPFPYMYNVKNTTQLMKDLTEIPQGHCMKFASFDINNMYSNIPTSELTTILYEMCKKNDVDDKTRRDIMSIAQTVINLNYFQFQDTTYIQNEGLAMRAPTSSILSEVYLQHLENTTIPQLLEKHSVKGYFRYVYDILLAYIDDPNNDIHSLLNEVNSLTPKLRFTLEEEQDNHIHFLDITITKNPKGLSFDIYRKPTTTDIIIPRDSCHPNKHKTAAINYYCNRLETYHLTPRNKEKEIIEQILTNNKYDPHLLTIE